MAELTRDQLMQGLRRADAAGDEDAARAFARRIRSMESQAAPAPAAPAPKPAAAPESAQEEKGWQQNIRDGLAAVNQGLSFGFSDEIISAGAAPLRAFQDDIGLLEAYRKNQAEQKANREGFREESPYISAGLEMAGAVPTGVAGANLALNKTALGAMAPLTQAGGLGALEGAAYGAGTAEEGERMQGALEGGAIGMVAGPVAAKGVDLATRGGRSVLNSLATRVADTPSSEAQRGIRRGLLSEFGNVDDAVDAYMRTGPQGTLADTADSVLETARGAMRTPDSNARNIVTNAMDMRQRGQQGRLMEAAADGLGVANARASRDLVEGIATERSRQAAPLYDEAYQQWLPVEDDLFKLMDRPALKSATRKANNLLREEGIDPEGLFRSPERAVGGRLAVGNGDETVQAVNVQYIDYLKRALDDQYSAARSRAPQKARAILNTKRELLSLVDENVPQYQQARQLWSDAKTLEDARDLGRNVFSRKEELFDLEDRVSSMADSEKMMFRAGVMETVQDKIGDAGDTQNAVSRILRSTNMRERLRNAFDSEEQFERFIETASLEDQFSRNRNTLSPRSGSQTDLLATSEGVLSENVRPQGVWDAAARVAEKVFGREVPAATKEEFARIATDNSLSPGQLQAMLEAPDIIDYIGRLEIPDSAKAQLSGVLGLEAGILSESQR